MNPIIQTLVVICCLGASLASRSANQYVENVIQTSLPNEARAMGVEPALLANFNVQFQNKGRITGDVSFTNGNATGFSRVRRGSECTGPKMVRGELTINCTLSLSSLTTSYRLLARNGTTVSYGLATGRVSDTSVYVVIAGHPQNYVGSVKNIQITRMGSITPAFSGLAPVFQKQVSSLQTAYRNNVSAYVLNVIQQKFVYALGRALAYKPMPRQ